MVIRIASAATWIIHSHLTIAPACEALELRNPTSVFLNWLLTRLTNPFVMMDSVYCLV